MGMRSTLPRAARLAVSASLALASAGALTGAILLGSAQAATAASASTPYSCNIAGVVTETLDLGVTATAPASVAPGGTVTLTNVTESVTVPASLVTLLIDFEHLSTFSGTVSTYDFNATGATPATINAMAGAGAAFTVKVTSGKPATISVPATPQTVGPWTAGSSGTVNIFPGNVVVTTKLGAVKCAAPSSPTALASIPITSGSTSSSVPGTTVPATHTGEPWAGWPYWMLIGIAGVAGLGSIERATRIRRRKA